MKHILKTTTFYELNSSIVSVFQSRIRGQSLDTVEKSEVTMQQSPVLPFSNFGLQTIFETRIPLYRLHVMATVRDGRWYYCITKVLIHTRSMMQKMIILQNTDHRLLVRHEVCLFVCFQAQKSYFLRQYK